MLFIQPKLFRSMQSIFCCFRSIKYCPSHESSFFRQKYNYQHKKGDMKRTKLVGIDFISNITCQLYLLA